MTSLDIQDQVERFVARRARFAFAFGIVLISTQAVGLSNHITSPRPAAVQFAAWAIWMLMLAIFLATGGGWLRSPAVRAMMNDESSDAHRRQGLIAGFWAGFAAAALVYAISCFEILDGRDTIRIVITTMVAAALLRFAALERRSLRDA